jgi:hypothetical protein
MAFSGLKKDSHNPIVKTTFLLSKVYFYNNSLFCHRFLFEFMTKSAKLWFQSGFLKMFFMVASGFLGVRLTFWAKFPLRSYYAFQKQKKFNESRQVEKRLYVNSSAQ